MKKITLLPFLFMAVFFVSCHDDSGDFAEKYYPDSEKSTALKQCLNLARDTANAHLSVPGGYTYYNNAAYRINLPTATTPVIDTLAKYGQQSTVDSLIIRLNRAAERTGDQVRTVFGEAITQTTFYDPDYFINGSSRVATEYFRSNKTVYLIDNLRPWVQIRMNETQASATWNQILATYAQYTTQPVNIDLNQEITRQMVNHLLTEMGLEEQKIRTDPAHRKTTLLKEIFK